MSRRPRTAGALALAVLTAGALAACGSSDPMSSGGDDSSGSIVVGSADFPESELLMEMYAQALQAKGLDVTTQPGIGSREVYMAAFEDGSIDVLPEYNGALLSYLSDGGAPEGVTSSEDVYAALQDVLPEGAQTLTQSAAQDVDVLTVTAETAEKYDLESIADLADVSDQLVLGGPAEWKERHQGVVGLEEVYGVTFKEFTSLDAGGTLTVEALKSGDIDVADLFSTDSNLTTYGWVTLSDPENLFLSENVVPLVRSEVVTDEVEQTLDAVSAALTTENLTAALAEVQVDKKEPATVAEEFLTENGLV